MSARSEEPVFRHLPDVYRRAGRESTPAYALLGAAGTICADLEIRTRQVLASRFLHHLNDLDDAERLSALFQLAPWPEEDLDEFRFRVQHTAAIYLRGAATARSILELVGAACEARVDPESVARSEQKTSGELVRRAGTGRFTATVEDAPPAWHERVVEPASGWAWEIENRTYATLDPDEAKRTYPEPVVDIEAGDRPVVLPVLVQRPLRRLFLVNRVIPPGSAIRVDLRDMTVTHLRGAAALLGSVTLSDGRQPDLLFGTGGLIGDPLANQLSGPDVRTFHVLRWSPNFRRGEGIPVVPGVPKGAAPPDPVPIANIPLPPLLGFGRTHWRLMAGRNLAGEIPDLDEPLPSGDLRVAPLSQSNAPARVRFRWRGGKIGTFTVRFPEQQLADGPDPQAPMAHRAQWLKEQIERIKPAGVIYLEQGAPELAAEPPGREEDWSPALHLWDAVWPADTHTAAVKPAPRNKAMPDEVIAGDKLTLTVREEKEE